MEAQHNINFYPNPISETRAYLQYASDLAITEIFHIGLTGTISALECKEVQRGLSTIETEMFSRGINLLPIHFEDGSTQMLKVLKE